MTQTIEVYSIDELSPEVKQKVIDNNRTINTDGFEWWDMTYDDFVTIASKFGFMLDKRAIYFSGFSNQGDGASFECKYILLSDWKRAHKSIAELKAYAPVDKELERIFKWYQKQIKSLHWTPEDESVSVYREGYYYHSHTMRATIDDDTDKTPPDIDAMVLAEARELADWLYATLERECEYLESDEVVLDTLKINEYTFTESGTMV